MNAKQLEVVNTQKLFPIKVDADGKATVYDETSALFVGTEAQVKEALYEYICECEFTDKELGIEEEI